MSTETHNGHNETKRYIAVFVVLVVLTAITVAVSGLKIGITIGVILALIIATVKGALVACNFMHLTSEKRSVYFVLILAVIFVIVLIAVICISHFNVPEGLKYVS